MTTGVLRMHYRTPAVILGVHYGSLGIARSLGRLGVDVHGVNADVGIPAFTSRYFRHRHAWNFAKSSREESVAFLLGLRARIGQDAVLVPTTDDWAQLVADHAATLRSGFRFQDNPPALVRSLRSKWELFGLAMRHGVPTPKTLLPASLPDALNGADELGFPLLVKGSDGARLEARGLKKMVIVRSPRELAEHFSRMEDPANPELMLQEYIPGGDDCIWMFNGYFDRKGECVAAFTGRKLRQHPVHTGATSLGLCTDNQAVRQATVRFLGALGYRGIVDIGFRHDARDGGYKVLDVNPRIGATFRLFASADGTDVARLLYRDMTGLPLPAALQVEGRKWLDEHRDLYASRDYRREGTLTVAAWMSSLRNIDETAWIALDDPVPALRMASEVAGRTLRRTGRALFGTR